LCLEYPALTWASLNLPRKTNYQGDYPPRAEVQSYAEEKKTKRRKNQKTYLAFLKSPQGKKTMMGGGETTTIEGIAVPQAPSMFGPF